MYHKGDLGYVDNRGFNRMLLLVCVITCQNFVEIWQVCSSDGMFVCLSVCLERDTGHSF